MAFVDAGALLDDLELAGVRLDEDTACLGADPPLADGLLQLPDGVCDLGIVFFSF
jgi:hypothetical protein